jgi:hypothetical protein
MYGSVVVAGIGEWSLSGFVPEVAEDTAFGDTVKKWADAGIGDGGTVSFSGNYDPADTNGQVALAALQSQGAASLTNLYFYESTSVFWRVASGGSIIITKFPAPSFKKNGLATISFEGRISGKFMERVV